MRVERAQFGDGVILLGVQYKVIAHCIIRLESPWTTLRTRVRVSTGRLIIWSLTEIFSASSRYSVMDCSGFCLSELSSVVYASSCGSNSRTAVSTRKLHSALADMRALDFTSRCHLGPSESRVKATWKKRKRRSVVGRSFICIKERPTTLRRFLFFHVAFTRLLSKPLRESLNNHAASHFLSPDVYIVVPKLFTSRNDFPPILPSPYVTCHLTH